jgi:regulator of RNase E activity RraB
MTEREIRESINGHDARNAELLATIRDKGIALDEERSVEHHFWAPNQTNAAGLARELYNYGYMVLAISPTQLEDGSTWWNVEAEIKRAPGDAASHETSEELIRLAAQFDASYDGWGTSI